MMDYCKDKFLDVKLNTNASLLTKANSLAIMNCCNTVVFSIDTPNPDTYPNIRVNGSFERVMENIRLFNSVRGEHPRSQLLKTRVSGVFYDPNSQEFSENSDFFSEYVDEVSFVQYQPWEKLYTFIHEDMSQHICTQPFHRFFIWFDGTFNACDMDYKSLLCNSSQLRIGVNSSIHQAWSSKIMSEIRRYHLTGERSKLKPCDICPNPL